MRSVPFLFLLAQSTLMEEYRKVDFSQKQGKFDEVCRKRLGLEFELIRRGDPEPFRTGLKDPSRDVRGFAAAALGILEDRASAASLARLAQEDPDVHVRLMALQGLGWLKAGEDVIIAAKSDPNRDVRFMASVAEAHLKDARDLAARVREAYTVPLRPEEMGSAQVGKPAPDFAVTDCDGRPFRLSAVLKKQVVVLAFQLADW